MARIIVIDDNDAARVTMRRVLEKAGHQVLEASDGDAGLKLLAEIGVTLVITDIFMPRQDGIVTLRRIRKEFPGVRVIAVSGGDATGRIDLRRDAELLGAARTLRKPFAPGELRRAVEETLALDTATPPYTQPPRSSPGPRQAPTTPRTRTRHHTAPRAPRCPPRPPSRPPY